MKRKEELTEKMHSEFSIDKETQIKHKAWTVWSGLPYNCSIEQLEKECAMYGISVEVALKYKDSWFATK